MEPKEWERFEYFIVEVLRAFNLEVIQYSSTPNPDNWLDFVINYQGRQIPGEIKFFRSKNVKFSTILKSAEYLAYILSRGDFKSGLLIISSYLTSKQRTEIKDKTGITIWDRSVLFNILSTDIPESILLERLSNLLLDARLGTDTRDVFDEVEIENDLAYNYFDELIYDYVFKGYLPQQRGEQLCDELTQIEEGKNGWSAFEIKCEEILKYLFDKDLNVWNRQARTDDQLSRFDLICRINSEEEFWKTLIQSFNSKYLLFEFKNYSNPIGQDQIFSTERYLFTKALRSAGIIIARNGAKNQAKIAAKGALREHGKLLIILTPKDLCIMLDMKDNGKVPSEYLSEKLDEILISLSR